MQYGRIQAELRELLIKKGRIYNLGRTYSELASQNVKPSEHQLKSFIDKLRTEFKIRIVYQTKFNTLYSSTLVLLGEKENAIWKNTKWIKRNVN